MPVPYSVVSHSPEVASGALPVKREEQILAMQAALAAEAGGEAGG